MLGNGWQWTADWSSDRYSGADEIDPQGPATGTLKILRGGSWRNGSKASRVSTRLRGNFDGGFSFRCAGNSLDPQVTTPIPAQLPAPHPGVPVFDAELGREVYRPGGAVSVPRILRKGDPEYSEEARQAKINGTVMLKIVIDEQGNVVHPTVLRGLGFGLDQKAVQAVKKWKFAPAQKDGHPIPAFAQVQVVFRLL
jgi:TonB family protein